MKTSFQFIALGVGVWMVVGSIEVGQAQPSVSPPQKTPTPLPRTSAQTARPTSPVKLRGLRDRDGDPLPPGAIPLARATTQTAQTQPSTPAPPVTAPETQPSAPLPTAPGSSTPPSPQSPNSPGGATPAQQSPTTVPGTSAPNPVVPAAKSPVTIPEFLNPSPNPLQFPTRPSEVQIRAVQPITLQQAIELAERNNRDIQVSRLQVERNQAAIREARAGNFPTLGLTSSLTRSGDAFITSESQTSSLASLLGLQQNQSSTSTAFALGAQLNYDLFTFGARPAQIRAAERQARVSELQLEQTREATRLQVITDYYNLQNADQQVLINEAAVRNAEANLRDAQAQERAGLGTRFDVLRAEVNLANAQQQLTNARATQAVNRRQLVQRLSLSESVNLVAADPVEQAGSWTLPLEDTIVLAYRNRAELEQQLVQREVSEEQIRLARAQNGPTLSFAASYQFQRSGTTDTESQNSDNYSLALQARWNLFDGGATNAQIAQRQREKEIAETQFAQNRNQIRFEVEQAFSNLQANLANITTTAQAVAQAEEALRLAILRFQAGVGTQTDRISAEAALTQARANRVTAIIGYNQALAQLQRAVSNVAR